MVTCRENDQTWIKREERSNVCRTVHCNNGPRTTFAFRFSRQPRPSDRTRTNHRRGADGGVPELTAPLTPLTVRDPSAGSLALSPCFWEATVESSLWAGEKRKRRPRWSARSVSWSERSMTVRCSVGLASSFAARRPTRCTCAREAHGWQRGADEGVRGACASAHERACASAKAYERMCAGVRGRACACAGVHAYKCCARA
eukprot:6173717-Pleurochrysis_carterae.AAC.2